MDIFVAVPSYKGISEEEAAQLVKRDALTKAGHRVAVAVIRGAALLDQARAELTAMFVQSPCQLLIYQDDDVDVSEDTILRMVELVKDYGTLSAPYKMRGNDNLYDVVPTSAPDTRGVAEILWTGLGCVLVNRDVVEDLQAKYVDELGYASNILPDVTAVGLFNSVIVPCSVYGGPEGKNMNLGDDRAWSYRAKNVGHILNAYVEAKTNHRGLEGCLGNDMRASEEASRKAGGASMKPLLVGVDGRPL